MGDIDNKDDYMVGRNYLETVRLNYQHLVLRLHTGYVLHPKIPVQDGMRILDIGTGTGIWLLDLAEQVPSSVQLDGYDISDEQFAAKYTLPPNVSLSVLDFLGNLPKEMLGQYDVVHIRFWSPNVRGNDPSRIIQQAISLLKPGGYLQWEESRRDTRLVQGPASEEFEKLYDTAWKNMGISFEWVSELPETLEKAGFNVIVAKERPYKKSVEWLEGLNYLMSSRGVLSELRKVQHDFSSAKQVDTMMDRLHDDCKHRNIFPWTSMALVAQKQA